MDVHDAWRGIVHAVQLERGCSCAFVGSGAKLYQFELLVDEHRTRVDTVLRGSYGTQFKSICQPALTELRATVDAVRRFGGRDGTISNLLGTARHMRAAVLCAA